MEQVQAGVVNTGILLSNDRTAIDEQKWALLLSLEQGTGSNLNTDQNEKVLDLLCTYANVLTSSVFDLGRTTELKHCINTAHARLIRQCVHHLPQCRNDIKRLISMMLERGIVNNPPGHGHLL